MSAVRIDSRVIGFNGKPVRILALCMPDTGEVLVEKKLAFTYAAVSAEDAKNTVVVTDAREQVRNWQLAFSAKEHLEDVIRVYQMRKKAGLIELHPDIQRFDPANILETRKIDKNGPVQEFDSSNLDNTHIAVLLAVWASAKISTGLNVASHIHNTPGDDDDFDDPMMPFSM